MRTWMRFIPAVLLVLPFTGSLLGADGETNAKSIEQLQQDVKQLREDIKKLEGAMTQHGLRGARIEEHYTEILRRLDHLAKQQQTIERIAGYGPPPVPGNAVPMTTGTITLENSYAGAAQVRINGQMYTVGAFQTIQVPRVPTGSFDYSVEANGLLLIAPHPEMLTAAGYRIRIYPR